MNAYAELVCASNFSFLRGASHPEELVAEAKSLGLAALAVADRNTLAGVVRAHKEGKARGFKTIVSTRLVLQNGVEIACLPTNRDAYGRLCQLLTTGNIRAPKAACYLWLDDVLRFGEGQIFIVLPPSQTISPTPRILPAKGRAAQPLPPCGEELGDILSQADFVETTASLAQRFPRHVYLGAPLAFDGQDARRLALLAALADETGAPLVAIGDCLYHTPARKPLQDVLTCIREKCTIQEAGYRIEANAERHLKSPAEILRLYRGYEAAAARTLDIAARCRFSLDELRYEYPDEPFEPFTSPQEALIAHTWEGAAGRYPDGVPEKVKKQIEHELALIERLEYSRYFLTVRDIVRFARSKDILCQGRGSAANSTVCYCLGITAVDPAHIDLLFERFISAERNEPPDIDVDFEHERREEVIQYIYGKYGRHRTAIAATVITYRAKSAIREVGKALGLSEDMIGALAGMIWWWSADGVQDEHLREIGLDPRDRTLQLAIRLSSELIGFPRHLSQHTGGFVITRGLLETIVPIGNAAMADRTMVEWDKDDLDTLGLMKIDVLALGMLSCVRKCFGLLQQHYGIVHNLASIPQDDAKVYDMICKADTLGVFQIESRAQMSMLPRLRPRNFYDLVIEVAIVRPGPIQGDMVHPYLRRRQGLEDVEYQKDALEEVLKKTLGVPLFQEQAMKIAIVAGGFTPEEADQLRRAMATFRHAGTIHRFGVKLIEGMKARGYAADFAERCFRQIEGFGEYGFPESHAASFALLVYVSSWLKCYYPNVFACALINSQPMGFYAPAQIVRDFRDHGGEARAVDINHSHWDCMLEPVRPPPGSASSKGEEAAGAVSSPAFKAKHRALRLGFRLVKGFGPADAGAIVAARASPYTSVEDFARRTRLAVSSLQTLAEADAFRSIGLDRRQALWAVARYHETGTPAVLWRDLPLFAAAEAAATPAEPEVELPVMSLGEHVLTDYALMRMSLKAHPMALLRGEFASLGYVPSEALKTLPVGGTLRTAGIVLIRQRPGSANGVIFSTLEDETGIANLIIWPAVFERFRRIVLSARLLGVRGKLQREQGVIHVVVQELYDMSGYLNRLREEHEGEIRRPVDHYRAKPPSRRNSPAALLPKGRNFH